MIFSQASVIRAEIRDRLTNNPLEGVEIRISRDTQIYFSDNSGKIEIESDIEGQILLSFSLSAYKSQILPLFLKESTIELGPIYMEIDLIEVEHINQSILSEAELGINDGQIVNTGALGATRDLLVRRAAFDFSPVFFKIRGYDSRSGFVLLNGIPMNSVLRGRPQWNSWGGLNDVFRNQETMMGLRSSPWHFGDVLGVANISTRPSILRQGFRFSSSYSNKTYSGRLMATFNDPPDLSNWGYTISASRRWTDQGYIEGTSYDAFSIYGAIEYKIRANSGFHISAFLATNRRGRKSAITDEAFKIVGRRYNPYWGFQQFKKRNSRIRKIAEPVVMLNYWARKQKIKFDLGIVYQWGSQANSRLGYFNAPNPLPDYYRYLPSFHINSPIGANFISAKSARAAFEEDPQLNWSEMYRANQSNESNKKASYILYDDSIRSNSITAHGNMSLKIGNYRYLDLGLNIYKTKSEFFSRITDLLGAEYHLDEDPFSNTSNSIGIDPDKYEGDIFGYHYLVHSRYMDAFIQLRISDDKWNGFIAGKYYFSNYQRDGIFLNERYPDNSQGKSKPLSFTNYGIKCGLSYEITRRHRLEAYAGHIFRPPTLSQVFINPRENNNSVPNIKDEMIDSAELSYRFDLPKLQGRLSAYYTRFHNTVDINFFFVDSGLGSDFVQQVLTGLDRLHKGLEFGVNVQASSTVNLNVAVSLSEYLYASNPDLSINFDTAGVEEDLINIQGEEYLGVSQIKGYKLSRGPATAISLGLEYRDPDYWWFSSSLNRLSENYIGISPITRTQSFRIDPETNIPFAAASNENVQKLLVQKPLPVVYLLNLNAGKSWIWGEAYITLFGSITNLLDVTFKSGGYEQSRNGNFGQLVQDNLSASPSFGPKYWFGFGRTVFLNIAISI